MPLSLNDAISHYRATVDTTHKFWGYFQVVAGGTAAFAWSQKEAPLQLFIFLTLAFAVFAVLNWRLVFGSQQAAVTAKRCIKNLVERDPTQVPKELTPLIAGLNPDSAPRVGIWHGCLSVAVVAAVWWRFATLC